MRSSLAQFMSVLPVSMSSAISAISTLLIIILTVLWTQARAGTNSPVLEGLLQEAMNNNQDLQALADRVNGLKAEAPFAGSLQDPVLTLGLANIPVDTFDFDQEAMTQKQVSISQKVPWFGTLDLAEQGSLLSALKLEARLRAKHFEIAKQVRQAWYDLTFIEKSLRVNDTLQVMLDQILKVTEKRYATGKGLQQDVLAGQVQLSELIDERINLKSKKRMLQDRLGSLLNRENTFTESSLDEELSLPLDINAAGLNELIVRRNPLLQERNLAVEKAKIEVQLAQKAYMPDMTFRAGYGQREDDPFTGSDRSDFFSASVSLTVPLWQNTRQDSKLAGAEKRLVAAKKSVSGLLVSLPHQIDSLISEIESAVENYNLFKDALTVQAGLLAESSLAAYSVGKVEFGTMLTSRIRTVRYELKAENYKYLALKKLAELDELTGEPVVRASSRKGDSTNSEKLAETLEKPQ